MTWGSILFSLISNGTILSIEGSPLSWPLLEPVFLTIHLPHDPSYKCGLLSCHCLNLSVLGAWPLSIPTSSTVVMDNLSSATLYFRNIWMSTLRDALCLQYVALPCLASDSAFQTSHTTTVALTDTAWTLSSTIRDEKGKRRRIFIKRVFGRMVSSLVDYRNTFRGGYRSF